MEHHRAGSNGPAYFGGTRNLYAMSCGWPPSAVPQDENKEMVTHVDAAASPLRHGGSNPPGSIFHSSDFVSRRRPETIRLGDSDQIVQFGEITLDPMSLNKVCLTW